VLGEKLLQAVLQVGELSHLLVRLSPHFVQHGGNFRVTLCKGKLLKGRSRSRVDPSRVGDLKELYLLLLFFFCGLRESGAWLILRRNR
jgi:hypothetical protein